MVYDRRDLCLDCAEEVLRFVLMPLLTPVLADVDTAVDAAISENERTLTASPISPPTSDITPSRRPSGWTCWNCKAIQPDPVSQCQCCRKQRPPDPRCCRCEENVLLVKRCPATRRDHVVWQCAECSLDNAEESVECRACHSSRKWYCASCSLENTWSRVSCEACGGEHKIDNLSSVVNREFLNQMGFSSDAQSMHREQQKQVEMLKEHTRRLEHRVDQLGLLPIPIDDDGNCLFRALSYQLVRTDVFFPVVRHMIVDHMESNRAEYALLIGGDDFDNYASGMRRNTIWGDELCVHAASRIFGAHIHVITSDEHRWHLRYEHAASQHDNMAGRSLQRRLYLCYRSPDHYYCLVHPTLEPRTRVIDLEATFRQWVPQQDQALLKKNSGEFGGAASTSSSLPSSGSYPLSPQRSSLQPAPAGSIPVVPNRLPAHLVPAKHSPPTTQEIPRFSQHAPPPASPPLRHNGNQVAAGPRSPNVSGLPATSSSGGNATHQLPSTRTGLPSNPPVRVAAGPTAAPPPAAIQQPAPEQARPMTRSTRVELQFAHFRLLPHPIMVRLCIASSNLNVEVTPQETVRQDRESTYFYLYAIQPSMILEGGPARYPWESIYQQTLRYVEEGRRSQVRMMPLFLLQHIRTGGFLCPGDDMFLQRVFENYEAVHCTQLFCRKTRDLASCLLTVDEQFTQSRSKLHIRFFKKEIKSSFLSLVQNSAELFCCEYPVTGSLLVVHQLFSGAPERLCLRCHQWYRGGRRGSSADSASSQPGGPDPHSRSPGGCDHFSQVDEIMEVISRY